MAEAKEKAKGKPKIERKGKTPDDHFLPFYTNAFDRVFIGAVLTIGIHLLWLRFLESTFPIVLATVISLIIGYYVVRRG